MTYKELKMKIEEENCNFFFFAETVTRLRRQPAENSQFLIYLKRVTHNRNYALRTCFSFGGSWVTVRVSSDDGKYAERRVIISRCPRSF